MKQFTYLIKRAPGIHARPACLLAMLAGEYKDTAITVTKDGKTVDCELLNLISLDARPGSEVTVAAEGPNEEAAIERLTSFFQEKL